MDSLERQQLLDEEHLRLLRIGYFVMGGTAAFTGLFGVLYAGMGAFMVAAFQSLPTRHGQAPPAFMAWFFAAFGLFIVVSAGTYAALAFLTARGLKLRRSRTLCLVTAGLSCLYVPFGTVLGIFTFSVFGRPGVLRLFGPTPPASARPAPPVVSSPPPPLPGGTAA